MKILILPFILAFFASLAAPVYAQIPSITDDTPKSQRFIFAAKDLENVVAAFHQKIKASPPEHTPLLRIQMGEEIKSVLHKHNLTEDDLQSYRQEVEKALEEPLVDPEFRKIIRRLNQKTPSR